MEKLELNKIYNEDCLKGMEKIKAEYIDLVITSPPYNIGVKYGKHKDNLPFEEYLDWMEDLAKKTKRILKEDGSFFFNIGDKPSDDFRSFEVAKRIAKHFKLQNTIHWIKHIAVPEENVNIGHYKPVNSYRYMNNTHEYIFHFTKKNKVEINKLAIGVPYADKSNIGRWKKAKQDKRGRGNIWFIPYETVKSQKRHPAAFPIKLPEMCIKLHGYDKNTIVLDPFMGSASTAIAANNLGCNYLGFEIDKKYIEISKKRIKRHSYKQEALEF